VSGQFHFPAASPQGNINRYPFSGRLCRLEVGMDDLKKIETTETTFA
jgi:hypothetical protein